MIRITHSGSPLNLNKEELASFQCKCSSMRPQTDFGEIPSGYSTIHFSTYSSNLSECRLQLRLCFHIFSSSTKQIPEEQSISRVCAWNSGNSGMTTVWILTFSSVYTHSFQYIATIYTYQSSRCGEWRSCFDCGSWANREGGQRFRSVLARLPRNLHVFLVISA